MAEPILRKLSGRCQDLTGQRFGKLIVLEFAGLYPSSFNTMWRCRCDCGNETVAVAGRLKNGSVASCGCLRSEVKLGSGVDLTGQRYGRVLVLGRGPQRRSEASQGATWHCRCDCGREMPAVAQQNLTGGRTTSCGCSRRREGGMVSHGYSKLPGYTQWATIKQRCHNPSSAAYRRYGAKGIRMCQRWQSFPWFNEDMGPRPSNFHSVDRIENSRGYDCGSCDDCKARGVPRNARWATAVEQSRNKGNNVLITHAGETLPLVAWAERTGFPAEAIKSRLAAGWSAEKALTKPLRKTSWKRDAHVAEAATKIRAMRDALAATLGMERANTVIHSACRLARSTEAIGG